MMWLTIGMDLPHFYLDNAIYTEGRRIESAFKSRI